MKEIQRKISYYERKGITLIVASLFLLIYPLLIYSPTTTLPYPFFENTNVSTQSTPVDNYCGGTVEELPQKQLSAFSTFFYDTLEVEKNENIFVTKLILLFIFALTGAIVFINLSLINRYSEKLFRLPDGLLAVAIFLFISHPINIEILLTKGGSELIFSLFFMQLSLLFTILLAIKKRLIFLAVAFIGILLALFSHHQAIPFVVFIPLIISIFFPDSTTIFTHHKYKKLINTSLIFAPYLISFFIFLITSHSIIKTNFGNAQAFYVSITQSITNCFYPQNMSIDYSNNTIPDFSNLPFLFIMFSLILFTAWLFRKKKIKALLLVMLLCLFFLSSIIYLPVFFDNPYPFFIGREYYIFNLAIYIIVSYLFYSIFQNSNWLKTLIRKKNIHCQLQIGIKIVGLLLVITLSTFLLSKTNERLQVWKTPYSLLNEDLNSKDKSFELRFLLVGNFFETTEDKTIADYNRIDSVLTDLIDERKDFVPSYLLLSKAYIAQNKNVSVVFKLLKRVIVSNSDCDEAFQLIFSLIDKFEDRETKILILDDIYSLYPDNEEINFRFGELYMVEKKYRRKAIFHFEKTIRKNPQHFEAYMNLGKCYEKIRNRHNAIQMYKIALNLRPDNQEVKKRLSKYKIQ